MTQQVGKTVTVIEGTQPGAGESSSPASAAAPALTQADLLAKFEKLEKDFHGYKSTTGKELADTRRQVAAYKAAGTISEDVISRLEDREDWLPDLVAQFTVDATLLEPYADYRSARAAAVKIRGSQEQGVKGLEQELSALKETLKTAQAGNPSGSPLPNEGGVVAPGRKISNEAIMDAYIKKPTPETRKAYAEIRGS